MAKKRKQARYDQRNVVQRGLIKVCIWIPEAARERVIKMAAELRRAASGGGS